MQSQEPNCIKTASLHDISFDASFGAKEKAVCDVSHTAAGFSIVRRIVLVIKPWEFVQAEDISAAGNDDIASQFDDFHTGFFVPIHFALRFYGINALS